jgi:polyhydroxyalkanoate synthase
LHFIPVFDPTDTGLYEVTLQVGGKAVDLKNIKVPLLHVMAQFDHIVPPECGKPLIERVGSQDKEEVLPRGHVSLVAEFPTRAASGVHLSASVFL